MACNVYSLPDVKAVMHHAGVGRCSLHRSGLGKITVSAAGNRFPFVGNKRGC